MSLHVAFLRTGTEVARIAVHEPFSSSAMEASQGKLQVAMLPTKPGSSARKAALRMATEEDLLAIQGRELYWLPSGRMSDSELDLKALESSLGPWTMRTMGTVAEIAARHCAS